MREPTTVRQARDVAAHWVAEHASRDPRFAGAYLSGSAAWLPADAPLPLGSDVDVMVVTEGAAPRAKLGKFPHHGVLLEVTYVPWDRLASPEAVLGSYHLAGAFRDPSAATLLADPTGRLAPLYTAISGEFARRRWVRRRCAQARRRVRDGLRGLNVARPWHELALAFAFPAGVTCHVLLTAALRNPTVRLRYLRVRELLAEHDRLELYEELLTLLGCARMTPGRVARHLRAMTEVFDLTVPVAVTPHPFSSDITPEARPIAVDAAERLVADGYHREAVFWILTTYARCLTILATDGSEALRARCAPGFHELLADLQLTSRARVRQRAREVVGLLPRLDRVAEEVQAAHPGVRD